MFDYVTAIGLDVHARSISACAFDPMTGEVTRARFGYDPASVAEWVLGFESPKAVYESGPTGFHLCRALRALGPDCAAGAVSKMHRPAADRGRKNDRRDAEWLARLLACRNVVEAWVPDDRTEAARDLSRALEDARDDLQRARQRMSKFLLRHGLVFDETTPAGRRRSNWTEAYWRWARSIEFGEADDAAAYEHYMDAVERCAEAKRELERKVEEAAARPGWAPVVDALCLVKGIDVASAFLLAAEAGDFSRFPTAPSFASWCGLAPRSARAARRSRAAGSPAPVTATSGARWSRRPGTSRCRRGTPRSRGRATGSRRPCRGTPRSATAACRTGGTPCPRRGRGRAWRTARRPARWPAGSGR